MSDRRGDDRGRADVSCKVYIGDLPRDATEKEIERTFGYYGPLRSVWIAQNPAGFAFAEFEDARDAEDAVRALDGTNLCGGRVRVEHSTGRVRPKPWNRGGGGGRGGGFRGGRRFDSDDRCYECGGTGHYAYDCPRSRRGGGGGGGYSRGGGGGGGGRRGGSYRSRSRSPRRRSHSRSRSRSQGRRSRSGSPRRGGDGK